MFYEQNKMRTQNSSKQYSHIIQPQDGEQPIVEVTILGQTKLLRQRDFFQLTQIINPNSQSQFKLQMFYSILSKQSSMQILAICVYYCIKVNFALQLQGIQLHYLNMLGNMYISSKFNIDICKFSHLTNKITNIPLRKCVHIIYYLVFGRLATNSYVKAIIDQLAPKSQNKNQKLKKLISSKYISKKQQINQNLLINSKNQLQNNSIKDQLMHQLKQIFHKKPVEKDHNAKFRQWMNQQQKQKQNQLDACDINNQSSLDSKLEKRYYMNFFPNRVFNQQKSAIFENLLPNFKTNYKLMRKKKFDDQKIQKMIYSTFNSSLYCNSAQNQRNEKPTVQKQRNKIFTHNIIKTNENFRNASAELDKIRYTLTQKTKKRNQIQVGKSIKQNICQNQKQYLQLIQKNASQQHNCRKLQQQNSLKLDYHNENQVVNLLRKQPKSRKSFEKQSTSKYSVRKDNKKLLNEVQINQGGQKNRIFFSSCQNRVNKYKNQFRKYMKLHLFHLEYQQN